MVSITKLELIALLFQFCAVFNNNRSYKRTKAPGRLILGAFEYYLQIYYFNSMSFCMAVFAPVSTRTKYIPLEIPSAFQTTL